MFSLAQINRMNARRTATHKVHWVRPGVPETLCNLDMISKGPTYAFHIVDVTCKRCRHLLKEGGYVTEATLAVWEGVK